MLNLLHAWIRVIAMLGMLFVPAALANFAIFQTYQPVNISNVVNTTFQGDTTKSISAITPSISCFQTGTLQTPAFIQCSASGTTATGSSTPYMDLQYVWTDNYQAVSGNAPDSFTLPSPLGTRSSSHQNGPEYAQVFRSAGTYTVTLTVSGCTSGHPAAAYTGGGGTCSGNAMTTATTTQTVTVSSWSGTDYYFNTSTGSDSNACSLGSPCLHPSKCASLIEGGSNIRCNFDCGQTFDGTFGGSLRLSANATYSHARIQQGGADCPGNHPVISMSSGTNHCFSVEQNGSGGVKADIVFSNIDCTDSGSYTGNQYVLIAGNNTGSGSVNNVFLDNTVITNNLDLSQFTPVIVANGGVAPATSVDFEGVVMWNVTSTNPVTGTVTHSSIIDGPQSWYSIVGGFMAGSGAFDPIRTHHIYVHNESHTLVRYVNTGPTCTPFPGCTPTRDSCIKTSFDPEDGDGTGTLGSFWLITENYCESTADLGGPGNDSLNTSISTITNYIQQQNVLFQISGISFPAVGAGMAVRDNWGCLTGSNSINISVGQAFSGGPSGENAVLASSFYRNLIYANHSGISTGSDGPMIDYFSNNNDVWTNAQNVYDNVLWNDNSTPMANRVPGSNFNSKGSFVDFNTYYMPNASGNFLENGASSVSLVTWQGLGFDTHGSTTSPGWSSPTTCGFGSWPY